MDKKSTFGLKLEQLANLFAVGVEKTVTFDDACDDREIADLLQSQLTTALPKDLVLFDSLLMMMGRLGCDARSLAGSLVHHKKKITQYSYEALAESFASLARQGWMAPQLAKLFTRASGICQKDKPKNEE